MYAELYSEDDDLLHKRKRVNTKTNDDKTNDDKTNDEPIIKNKQIVIGMIESPPYIYKDKLGNYTGYEYELIKEFVRPVVLSPTPIIGFSGVATTVIFTLSVLFKKFNAVVQPEVPPPIITIFFTRFINLPYFNCGIPNAILPS